MKIIKLIFASLFIWLLASAPGEAAQKCTRLVKNLRGEQLINACGSCRVVNIQRKRPGSAAPINRTLILAPKTTTDLSFRGPGHSRIKSDTSCKPTAANASKNNAPPPPKSDGKRCIVLQRTDKGGVTGLAVANTCKECRKAVIDRINEKGERKSQSIAIAARSLMPIPALGALQAAILDDTPCK